MKTHHPEASSTSFVHSLFDFNEQNQLKPLIKSLVEQSLEGSFCFDKNLNKSIHQAIQDMDEILSKQLSVILHHPLLNQLEGRWRGLYYLVKNSETGVNLKIKLMPCTKQQALHDFDNAIELDQSKLYKKIYEHEFGSAGGQPYAVILGDYEFSHQTEDLRLLNHFAKLSAAAFCPFIAAASPHLLGLKSWQELNRPRDLSKLTEGIDYLPWRNFREDEEARFVYLCLPRVLARLPYGKNTSWNTSFNFNELPRNGIAEDPNHYCWMNAAFTLTTQMTKAFSKNGWCISLRGREGGGRVDNLPLHILNDYSGELDYLCPTEINITDRREAELSYLGLLPLCHYKNTDYAVFFGAESVQKVKHYDKAEATENARISARLPYIMATSRFAHYLKMMARDKIGSFLSAEEAEDWLNRWILNYVNGNEHSKHELKAKYPLAEARIRVSETPGKASSYQATAWLKPWLQMEELTTSMRLVAKIPKLN